ncbi:MAG TPA: hypothetical protein ENN63_07385 [Bacteroidetes bacterium]|nr:hypothetical protein [Bacteroidota bacterium]
MDVSGKNFRRTLFAGIIWVISLSSVAQSAGEDLLSMVREGDLASLRKEIGQADLNARYGEEGKTLLQAAMESRQAKTARYLLRKGADPNQAVGGVPLLIAAVAMQNFEMVKLLLNYGAEVDTKDEKGNTALIFAAYMGNQEIARLLVHEGADYNYENAAGKTPLDYAIQFRNAGVSSYLRSLNARSLSRFFPDYHDGPHIVWHGSEEPFVFYMYRDSATDQVGFRTERLGWKKNPFMLRGFSADTLSYPVHPGLEPGPARCPGVDRILVMGDVHGGFDPMKDLLIRYGVIDSRLNWTWGDGHLVFVGDVFDRGDKVTETLWLIYRLEQQAAEAGGRVHLLLGNHEQMIMESDQRDISTKYFYLTSSLGIFYPDLFSLDTELGQWLRKKPVLVQINNMLFVHAGISPGFLQTRPNVEDVNRLIRGYLHGRPDTTRLDDLKLLLGEQGPLWYRGYFISGSQYARADSSFIDSVLNYFGVKRLVVGHNNVDEITPLYSGKVIAVDVPYYTGQREIQALLIRDDRLFRVRADGTEEELETGSDGSSGKAIRK